MYCTGEQLKKQGDPTSKAVHWGHLVQYPLQWLELDWKLHPFCTFTQQLETMEDPKPSNSSQHLCWEVEFICPRYVQGMMGVQVAVGRVCAHC